MAKGKNVPIRQHYVPSWYLRYFAIHRKAESRNRRIFVYERYKKKPSVRGINKVAVVKDFYTMIDPETLEKDYSLEKYYASVESVAAREISEIINLDKVTFDEQRKQKLAPFVGCLAIRTLQHLHWEGNYYEQESKRFSSLLERNPDEFLQTYLSKEVI